MVSGRFGFRFGVGLVEVYGESAMTSLRKLDRGCRIIGGNWRGRMRSDLCLSRVIVGM